MEETWADLPDIPGVMVSTLGRVRRWRAEPGGKHIPGLYKGRPEGSTVVYMLNGERWTIDELMRAAFGDAADEYDPDSMYNPSDRYRELTQYEINEIRLAEGYKPAFQVAEDFRIESARVRQVWDGLA